MLMRWPSSHPTAAQTARGITTCSRSDALRPGVPYHLMPPALTPPPPGQRWGTPTISGSGQGPVHRPPPPPPPSRMGTDETAEFNMGASTTKGPLPSGKVLSGWGRHTTASTSGHARPGLPLRSEERRQSNRRKGEPRAAQPEPPRTSRRRSALLPKERDEIALSAASDLRPVGRPQTTLMAEPIPGLRGPQSRGSLTSPHLTSPHLTSPHLTSPHLTSPHLTSPHLTSPHLTSPHLTSPHLTSPHLTSPHPTPPPQTNGGGAPSHRPPCGRVRHTT